MHENPCLSPEASILYIVSYCWNQLDDPHGTKGPFYIMYKTDSFDVQLIQWVLSNNS